MLQESFLNLTYFAVSLKINMKHVQFLTCSLRHAPESYVKYWNYHTTSKTIEPF